MMPKVGRHNKEKMFSRVKPFTLCKTHCKPVRKSDQEQVRTANPCETPIKSRFARETPAVRLLFPLSRNDRGRPLANDGRAEHRKGLEGGSRSAGIIFLQNQLENG